MPSPKDGGAEEDKRTGTIKSLRGANANGSPLRHVSRNNPGEPDSLPDERDLVAEVRSANIVLPEYRDGDLRGRHSPLMPGSTEANGNEAERIEDRGRRRELHYYQRRLKEGGGGVKGFGGREEESI